MSVPERPREEMEAPVAMAPFFALVLLARRALETGRGDDGDVIDQIPGRVTDGFFVADAQTLSQKE